MEFVGSLWYREAKRFLASRFNSSGCNDEQLMSKLLNKGHRDKDKNVISFNSMVQMARHHEQCQEAKTLMQQAKSTEEQVNFTRNKKPQYRRQQHQPVSTAQTIRYQRGRGQYLSTTERTCPNCGGTPHQMADCPARDQPCNRRGCGRIGHFAKVCRMGAPLSSKFRTSRGQGHVQGNSQAQTHMLDSVEPPQYDFQTAELYSVDIKPVQYTHSLYSTAQTKSAKGQKFFGILKLCAANDFKVTRVQLDTASTCNTLPRKVAESLIPQGQTLEDYMKPSPSVLYTYNNSKMYPIGQLEVVVETRHKYHVLTFQVIPDTPVDKPPLLSGSDCVRLKLVTIHADEVHVVDQTNQEKLLTPMPDETRQSVQNKTIPPKPDHITLDWVKNTFSDVHQGLGNFGKPIKFDLDPTINPIHDAVHRQPVAHHEKIKFELDRMESQGKICRQQWCSNMTVKETKDKFRICIDPSNTINKAIRVPKHPIPRLEDILPSLSGAKCFTVADALSGFTNIILDEESSLATTFHTPFGRYRWLRLPFGVSSGPEEYQSRMQEAMAGLPGVLNIADDVLIFGSGTTQEEAERDHDENLYKFLLRVRQVKLKLNPTKWRFKEKQVRFMGFMLGIDGVRPASDSVEAVTNMPTPTDVKAV